MLTCRLCKQQHLPVFTVPAQGKMQILHAHFMAEVSTYNLCVHSFVDSANILSLHAMMVVLSCNGFRCLFSLYLSLHCNDTLSYTEKCTWRDLICCGSNNDTLSYMKKCTWRDLICCCRNAETARGLASCVPLKVLGSLWSVQDCAGRVRIAFLMIQVETSTMSAAEQERIYKLSNSQGIRQ